jgi:hypothetical protein
VAFDGRPGVVISAPLSVCEARFSLHAAARAGAASTIEPTLIEPTLGLVGVRVIKIKIKLVIVDISFVARSGGV